MGIRLLVRLVCLILLAAAPSARAEVAARDAYARLQAIAGTWLTAGAAPLRVSYRLVSRDSALLETWGVGSGRETLTIFHLDGDRLLATHYCAQGNQPRLRLSPESTPARLVFEFLDATNLASPEASHLRRLELALRDADHLGKIEIYQVGGKDEATTFEFTREAGAPAREGL